MPAPISVQLYSLRDQTANGNHVAVLKSVVVALDACDTDMLQAVIDSYKFLVGNKLALGNK